MERGNSGRRLLIWDAPNMDMCLSEVIGERASAATRPNLGAVLDWLQDDARATDPLEPCVFCNVPPGFEAAMGPWVVSLRHTGFAVFVKPKRHRHDDVDAEMLRHIDRRFKQGALVDLVVASHDAKAFAEPLAAYAAAGVHVTVLGYREKDTFAAGHERLTFVDLEDVPGAFARPLPRTNLFGLPPSGRWFEPFPPGEPGEAGPGGDTTPRPRRSPSVGPTDPVGGRSGAAGDEAAAPPPATSERAETLSTAVGADPQVVEREDILALVEVEVTGARRGGRDGLTLRELGDLVRERFPGFALPDLGFASVGELVDALARRPPLLVVRQPGGHLVTLLASGANGKTHTAPTSTDDAPAWPGTESTSAGAATPLGPGEGAVEPTPNRPAADCADGTAEATPNRPATDCAAGSTRDPRAAEAGPDGPPDHDRRDTAPPPSLVHPIYRAFGIDRPH
jgi:uncharacterized protein